MVIMASGIVRGRVRTTATTESRNMAAKLQIMLAERIFRIFVDDTNLFASARDLKSLETLINSELKKVEVWCDVDKLSINFIKTTYMIIRSNSKASGSIEVKLQNVDGLSSLLERKDHIRYLGGYLGRIASFILALVSH